MSSDGHGPSNRNGCFHWSRHFVEMKEEEEEKKKEERIKERRD